MKETHLFVHDSDYFDKGDEDSTLKRMWLVNMMEMTRMRIRRESTGRDALQSKRWA